MNEAEARDVLAEVISDYRTLSFVDLCSLVDTSATLERSGPSGAKYQVEIQVLFDDRQRNLRILGAVDDCSLKRSFLPLTADFIMAPDGSFVGE